MTQLWVHTVKTPTHILVQAYEEDLGIFMNVLMENLNQNQEQEIPKTS